MTITCYAGPGEVAYRFFAAIEAGDLQIVKSLYHPDARIWHNTDGLEQSVSENLEVLAALVARTASRHYTRKRLRTFEGGFVQQHVLVAVQLNGREVELPAAIICEVENGRIIRIDEYFDAAQVAKFRTSGPDKAI